MGPQTSSPTKRQGLPKFNEVMQESEEILNKHKMMFTKFAQSFYYEVPDYLQKLTRAALDGLLAHESILIQLKKARDN